LDDPFALTTHTTTATTMMTPTAATMIPMRYVENALPVVVVKATVEVVVVVAVIAKDEKEVIVNGGGVWDAVGDTVGDAVKQQVVLQYFTASALLHEPNPRIALHTVGLWISGIFMFPE